MDAHTLTTQARTGTGKGNSRQLRRKGLMPAVFYGPTSSAATSLQLSPKDLETALSGEFGRNQLLKLDVDGQEQLALVKELQVHPVTRALVHVDFYSVTLESVVERSVPLLTTGKSKGVLAGADQRVMFRHLKLRGAPDKIPASIVLDVTELDLGDIIITKDVPLEAGVTIVLDGERPLVAIVTARKQVAEETDEEGGALGVSASGDTAAPADEGESK